jgi:hypothetical protein
MIKPWRSIREDEEEEEEEEEEERHIRTPRDHQSAAELCP